MLAWEMKMPFVAGQYPYLNNNPRMQSTAYEVLDPRARFVPWTERREMARENDGYYIVFYEYY